MTYFTDTFFLDNLIQIFLSFDNFISIINTLCLGRLQITYQAHMDSNLPVDSHRPHIDREYCITVIEKAALILCLFTYCNDDKLPNKVEVVIVSLDICHNTCKYCLLV